MPIINTSAREQIASWLRAKLAAGEYQEGDRLTEQPLAEYLGVSRGPIRDALLELTKEGVLVAKANCGVRVAPALPEATTELLVHLRRELETHALRENFASIDDTLRNRFRRHVQRFEALCRGDDMVEVVQEDMSLHRMIVEMSPDNLTAIWLPIVSRMRLPYSRHASLTESFEEHRAIVEAILDGDVEAATAALVGNIRAK